MTAKRWGATADGRSLSLKNSGAKIVAGVANSQLNGVVAAGAEDSCKDCSLS